MRRRLPVPLALAATAAAAAWLMPAAGHGQLATAPAIATVAGTGASGFGGDGGPAAAALLASPSDVAALPDGGYLVADTANHRIRRVAPDGTIATVAGAGPAGVTGAYGGDGVPATSETVRLNQPGGVAALPGGGFLVADTANHVVRHVAADGTIRTIAGQPGQAGLGGTSARSALLNAPRGVAALPDGSYLIADTGNDRVRRVDVTGAVTTVAGSGATGLGPATGSGIPAVEASLKAPSRVVALAGGGFLVADTGNHRVRRIDAAGTISTVAGSGTLPGFSGDGGPAAAAQLNAPEGIAVRPDGAIAIADTANQRIREVAADGTIRTLAGTGTAGFAGDGGAPGIAQLSSPRAVAQGPDRLLVADTANQRIRAIAAGPAPLPPPDVDPQPPPPDQPPPGVPGPTLGRNAVVAPLTGTVRVRLPGRRGFVALGEAGNVGLGAELDTRRGSVAVFFVTDGRGRGASAIVSGGRFRLLQPAVRFLGERPGLLALSEPLRHCSRSSRRRARAADATATAAAAKSRWRRLKVRANGRIRTKGKYGSAIVIGTEWTIADRCRTRLSDTTTVRVADGVVQVRDFVRHRSVQVRAGRRYVARTGGWM